MALDRSVPLSYSPTAISGRISSTSAWNCISRRAGHAENRQGQERLLRCGLGAASAADMLQLFGQAAGIGSAPAFLCQLRVPAGIFSAALAFAEDLQAERATHAAGIM